MVAARKHPQLSDAEAALWAAYHAARSIAARNALVEFYLPIVTFEALRLRQRIPFYDIGDFISCGRMGLIWAVERFDLSRRVQFRTWATPRIRGAMLDGIRDSDEIPKLARSHAKRLSEVESAWVEKHGGPPTDKQIRRRLVLSAEELTTWREDRRLCRLMVGTLYVTDQEKDTHMRDVLSDPASPNGEDLPLAAEWWDTLLRCLNQTEKCVVLLYYAFGWTMHQIGKHLAMSESRVSQITTDTLDRLKNCRREEDFVDIPSCRGVRLIQVLPVVRKLRQRRLRSRATHAKRVVEAANHARMRKRCPA